MNAPVILRAVSPTTSPRELASQLVIAIDALPAAMTRINVAVHDGEAVALDLLERLGERAEGIRRMASLTRQAIKNNADAASQTLPAA